MIRRNPIIIIDGKPYTLSNALRILSHWESIVQYAKEYMVKSYDCSILTTQASIFDILQNLAEQLEKRQEEEETNESN